MKNKKSLNTDESKIDGLLTYHLPDELLGIIWKGKFKGQEQQWYIMRFNGEEKEINIKTKHPEFLEWKWVDIDEITKLVVTFKLHVYEKIQKEIKKILPKNKDYLDKTLSDLFITSNLTNEIILPMFFSIAECT